MQYVKKAIPVEAVQFPFPDLVPQWLAGAMNSAQGYPGSVWQYENPAPSQHNPMGMPTFFVESLEGKVQGWEGDWLMRGIKGELYICQRDVFAESYDCIGGETAPPPERDDMAFHDNGVAATERKTSLAAEPIEPVGMDGFTDKQRDEVLDDTADPEPPEASETFPDGAAKAAIFDTLYAAQQKFELYADHHASKETPDFDKAKVNRDMVHRGATAISILMSGEVAPSSPESPMQFGDELEALINRHSMENGSDTPDFILASYLHSCLRAFDTATKRRDKWQGRTAT